MRSASPIVVTAILSLLCATAQAQVVIDTVTVGNPGNTGELSGWGAGGFGPDRICGAVDYVYNIGKFEITAGQYTEFLNAVADADTYGLYNTYMWSTSGGCGIQRSGSSGSYTYSVAPDWADRPVNYVSWSDAARFSNWLHNGQSTGPQGLATTEDGSYFLNGATTPAELMAITREPDATWVIPSEDEWYKAAYHKNDGVTGNYFDYPTSSDSAPSNDLIDPDPGNNATFNYTIGSPYYRTEVGAHENSDSPYGTFDQGGNVYEWNETILYTWKRGFRGGSFISNYWNLRAADRYSDEPTIEYGYRGFRVSQVSEPATLSLDIKPGSCPNSFNRDSHGVLAVALLGTAEFDVTTVDVDSLELTRADGFGASVTPLMGPPGPGIRVEDVATPFDGEPCDCHELGGDGIDDLSMKFDTEAIVAELELNDLPGGASVELVVSGESSDGAPFSASDCIRLVPPGAGSEGEPSGLPVGDHGLAGLPVSRQAMSPQDRSADDSSRQDTVTRERARSAGSESGDADQSEASQEAVAAPLAACGPLSSGLLLTMVAGIGLVRSRRR